MTMNASLLDRTFAWLLDRDGDLYGDEQERLRWYEASAAVMGIQIMAVSWVVAVAVLVQGRAVAPAMVAVLAAVYAPLLLVTGYVQRRHVRTVPERWSSKRILITILTLAPYLVAIVGLVRSFDPSDEMLFGTVTGVVLGLTAGLVALVVQRRREQARELDQSDAE